MALSTRFYRDGRIRVRAPRNEGLTIVVSADVGEVSRSEEVHEVFEKRIQVVLPRWDEVEISSFTLP